MNVDDFLAMTLEELEAWLGLQNAEMARLQQAFFNHQRERDVAYRVLKEKMRR